MLVRVVVRTGEVLLVEEVQRPLCVHLAGGMEGGDAGLRQQTVNVRVRSLTAWVVGGVRRAVLILVVIVWIVQGLK